MAGSVEGRERGRQGWRCGGCASDRTDGVHKARRAKLDREQKEREGEGEEVDEGENEHAVVGWGNKGTRESGKEDEKKREREGEVETSLRV